MTECISQLELGFLPRKQIVPRLEGGRVSSDGGPVSPASGLWRQLACAGRRICHKPLRALRGAIPTSWPREQRHVGHGGGK